MPRMSHLSSLSLVLVVISRLMTIIGQQRPWTALLPANLLALDHDLSAQLRLDPQATAAATVDFGKLVTNLRPPAAVLNPSTVEDIATLIRASYSCPHPFSIAARGHGHSIHGQAFAPDGVVVNMRSLSSGSSRNRINVSCTSSSTTRSNLFVNAYADVGGEQLWIEVLMATLVHGLAPRSWTDYLHLTVGGTLSNGGISGQAFRHGPQISNVYEMDVITGKGEVVTCSKERNSELFNAVLGGLGQFGIITRARIALEPAPQRVKWVRLLYKDFSAFTEDQVHLIKSADGMGKKEKMETRHFDYVEGSLISDTNILNNWRSSFFSTDNQVHLIKSADGMGKKEKMETRHFDYVEGSLISDTNILNNWRSSFFSTDNHAKITSLAANNSIIYCLEAAKYYDQSTANIIEQEVGRLLEGMSFIPGFVFLNDVPYADFLNRVHSGEQKLRAKGLWDVPHPWLNLLVPSTRIHDFHAVVFRGTLIHSASLGPILLYPVNGNKWDDEMSMVVPDEEVFYSVGLLISAPDGWEHLEQQNRDIIRFCRSAGIGFKQYLPNYRTRLEWQEHFGSKWSKFVERKMEFDPKGILSPGQMIFPTTSVVQNRGS